MVEPGKPQVLIWLWSLNRDSKEVRLLRDSTWNSQFTDQEATSLQKWLTTSQLNGKNNWVWTTTRNLITWLTQTSEAHSEWQEQDLSITRTTSWVFCQIRMAPWDTTGWMEEAILSHKTLEIQETCWKWLEDTPLTSQKEKDSMKIQKALLLSKDKNNKKNNLQKKT